MKFLLFLFCCVLLSVGHLEAALAAPPIAVSDAASAPPLMDRTAIEAHLGRRLKFTERIAFRVLQRKARKQQKKTQNNGLTDGLAVTSLVVGLGSIILLFANFLGFFTAIVGLILGIISLARINRNPEFRTGKGLAIAGIAINGGVVFLTLLAIAIIISAFN
ncbi:MAG: DUF4190 domain-containing protein [Lewinella sp.]